MAGAHVARVEVAGKVELARIARNVGNPEHALHPDAVTVAEVIADDLRMDALVGGLNAAPVTGDRFQRDETG